MIIVGENINASIPKVKSVIQQRKSRQLIDMAKNQENNGADYIDVNVGTGQGSQQDEIENMIWTVETLGEHINTPLCIDSADPAIIEAGLSVLNGSKGMINSTKAEESHLNDIMPLAARYDSAVVALAMDESGIPPTVDDRVSACRKIEKYGQKHGVPIENIFFDPLVLPISADSKQGMITLKTLAAIKSIFPETRTIMGLSNISYGLPGRFAMNAAFLHIALYVGLEAVIVNPLEKTIMDAILTGEALVGKDRHFRRYSRAFRQK